MKLELDQSRELTEAELDDLLAKEKSITFDDGFDHILNTAFEYMSKMAQIQMLLVKRSLDEG